MTNLSKYLRVVDIIFEVADARCPFTSRSRQVKQLIKDKRSLLILNKADLADPHTTAALALISTANLMRRPSEIHLLSFKSGMNSSSLKITAAATTGPARGPRPASSIPAINRMFFPQSIRS